MKNKADPYNPSPQRSFTAEEVILWLEGHRLMMFEVWRSNPKLRRQWEKLNTTRLRSRKPR